MNNLIPPCFSIVMVTYNSSGYVRQAIESVLNSNFYDYELIISDDNSSDDTWDIINEFSDVRIKKYRNFPNLGEYPNRNKAISYSSGKYLLFIDGDDMIYPHGLSVMYHYVTSLPACGMYLMRWYKSNVFYPVVIDPSDFYHAVYFNYGFNDISFANTLFNNDLLKKYGLPLGLKSGDNYIRLQLGALYKTALIVDCLTWWRETPNQASAASNITVSDIISEIEMKKYFLSINKSFFSDDQYYMAQTNIKIEIAHIIRRFIFGLKIKEAIFIFRQTRLEFSYVLNLFRGYYFKDPFYLYGAGNPATYKI